MHRTHFSQRRCRTRLAIKKRTLSNAKYSIPVGSLKEIKHIINKGDKRDLSKLQIAPTRPQTTTYAFGSLVWAKLRSCPWWPGVLVNAADIDLAEKLKTNQLWVFWLGDNRVSQVSASKLKSFAMGFTTLWDPKSEKKGYKSGVIEAIKIYRSRMDTPQTELEGSQIVQWAKNYFTNEENISRVPTSEGIPIYVKEQLLAMRWTFGKSKALKGVSVPFWSLTRTDPVHDLSSTCIACRDSSTTLVCQHPLFHGSLCGRCLMFCTVCSRSCNMKVSCNASDCQRFYCQACVVSLAAPHALSKITSDPKWLCFMCSEQPELRRLLKQDAEWELNVIRMYRTKSAETSLPRTIHDKPEIRILSLFDGIGTGMFVLKTLNLKVNAYFASEIDLNAMTVTKTNYSEQITHIGDVRNINKESLTEILPIDLLIGGSPCNDLSVVNPARKGLYDPTGTGVLFFEYVRVLYLLKSLISEDRPLFWLFENSSALPTGTKDTINRFLGKEPSLVDAKHLCPMHRARYFWGNIPGLETAGNILKNSSFDTALNSHLTPGHGRVQTVPKLRTVTTNRHSLLQGNAQVEPVMMNGQSDQLWITELESVFGFPRHYTDVANISINERHKLLGRAWSVPVVKKILQPLRSFFKER